MVLFLNFKIQHFKIYTSHKLKYVRTKVYYGFIKLRKSLFRIAVNNCISNYMRNGGVYDVIYFQI